MPPLWRTADDGGRPARGEALPTPPDPVVIATDHTWIDSEAVDQLRRIAALPGALAAAGMPDLHPGQGAPIGAALLADRVYPHLVGSDIGCGVAVWPFQARRLTADRIVERLTGLDSPAGDELPDDWCERFDAPRHEALGTVGGGNHFLEISRISELVDDDAARAAGLSRDGLVLLVHSGSRGLGADILTRHVEAHGTAGCPEQALPGYLAGHGGAVRFGRANRAALAARVADRLRLDLDPAAPLLDLCHNSVTTRDSLTAGSGLWLHRKGAAPADGAPGSLLALPGSRGTRSHLVAVSGDDAARARALWSVAHGAGRKHSRATARARYAATPRRELETTRLGSRVICEDPALLAEEAPGAYKDVEDVVQALSEAGLVRPVAALTPLVTYKTRAAAQRRDRDQAARRRDEQRRGRR